MAQQVPPARDVLKEAPSNWQKWGADDEVGSLNYLTAEEVLRGVEVVRQGKVFTLQVPIGHPDGDPAFPDPRRQGPRHLMTLDKGHYLSGKGPDTPGGLEGADDYIAMNLQGTTHYDALGHIWYDDQQWNGYDATTSIGGLEKASILPIADRGVVGRAVLIDMARHRGKEVLDKGESFDHNDLEKCAQDQGTPIEPHDILLIRTGLIGNFYKADRDEFYADFIEPGLTYSKELAEWFRDMEIPNLVTDTLANERTVHPDSGMMLPLHGALMRNLGVVLTEIAWLDDLASDSAEDGQYACLYAAAPLKVVGGTGAPANPIAIK